MSKIIKKPVFRPKKGLGQNFLINPHIPEKILQACGLGPQDTVVEIGPGQGVLSRLIAPKVKRLICVETDRDLIGPLHSHLPAGVEIVHADFLKWDIPEDVKIIGNIPYYISTPIIEKLIQDRLKISSAFLTVQLEFGQRLTAQAGGKDYGSLSCFTQYYADIKMLFKIKNTCFKPAPKVDSCFIRMTMRPWPQGPATDEQFLFTLVQKAFQQRRKIISNALKGLVDREQLEGALKHLNINATARPENLTLSDYISLCRLLIL